MDIDRDKLFLFLRDCHNEDKGFGMKPGSESDMESTRFAFQSFLSREPPEQWGIGDWLRKCQDDKTGAFRSRPSAEPDLASTYYGLILLYSLEGRPDFSRRLDMSEGSVFLGGSRAFRRCVRWVLKHQNPDGGFASEQGQQPDIDNTFYALNALDGLVWGLAKNRWIKCFKFVVGCQTGSGSFSNRPDLPVKMESTYCGIRCIVLLLTTYHRGFEPIKTDTKLNVLTKRVSRTNSIKWILSCQNNKGAFGSIPGVPPKVSDTYWAIHGLRILQERDTPFASFPNREGCANWLRACQAKDGGFKSSPESSEESNVWYTYCAVQGLRLLNFI